jgi:hypothetical protein
MLAMRQIIEDPQEEIVLKVPPEMRHRRTEVIVLTLGDRQPLADEERQNKLASLAGAWAGEPLTRDDQGTPEVRTAWGG